jgi:ferredoxin
VKVFIDQNKCQGHNVCLVYNTSKFDTDEMGTAHVVGDPQVPETDIEDVMLAEQNCPERAIRTEP